MSGEHNPMYGKHHSSKVIEILKNREYSKGTRHKMSIAKKNKGLGKENNNAKPVIQLTKDYKVIKQYPSLVDAANETGYNYDYLREATEHRKIIRNGKITFREFAYGYRWLKITEWEERLVLLRRLVMVGIWLVIIFLRLLGFFLVIIQRLLFMLL